MSQIMSYHPIPGVRAPVRALPGASTSSSGSSAWSRRATHPRPAVLRSGRVSDAHREGRALCQPPAASASVNAATAELPEDEAAARNLKHLVLPNALALLLCNMDRICLSVAIIPIAAEFGWAPTTIGIIQSSFLWGYMATQLLGGTLADRLGGKVVMATSIAWFSVASVLTPLALSNAAAAAGLVLPLMIAARAAVGLGEGVALPSMNNLVATHAPPGLKATSLGMIFSGFHCGNLVGLAVSPFLLLTVGWKGLFLIFGFLGLPMLLLWNALVPEKAAEKEDGPSQAPGPLSMGDMFKEPALWAIIIVNFVNHWGYFIYLNWMPSYFANVLGLNLKASSFMSFIPWVVMAVGSSLAGVLADKLIAHGIPVVTVRKGIQSAAFLGPAASLLVLANSSISPQLALICLTAALGITSLGQAGFVANMSDIAPRHAGRIFGLCNTFGSFAGILGVSAVGLIVDTTGSFDLVFKITACMYVFAVAIWNMLCRADEVF